MALANYVQGGNCDGCCKVMAVSGAHVPHHSKTILFGGVRWMLYLTRSQAMAGWMHIQRAWVNFPSSIQC